ncbi:MAG: Mov34/MPN/PAD-1 family protein [bacterium]|nr:Mov34/MPN/PAD-1 family protein [bacterium]
MRFTDGITITIRFEESVIACFEKHRQLDPKSTEAGGQLYARYSEGEVLVCKATGPKENDKRGRFFFLPNRKSERAEIRENYADGLHFVGDWHTHPESIPEPSIKDLKSIRNCYRDSEHSLKYFIMVIIGTESFPSGISVSVHNEKESVLLLV